ncbi:MAG: hypothetical protein ABR881_25630, partial [Candidatus Sulfotelmatobacter sp.]
VATTIIIKMHRTRYAAVTLVPLAWLVAVTFTASWHKILDLDPPSRIPGAGTGAGGGSSDQCNRTANLQQPAGRGGDGCSCRDGCAGFDRIGATVDRRTERQARSAREGSAVRDDTLAEERG